MPPLLVCQYQPVLCMMPSFTIITLFGTQFVRCALSIDLGKENRLIPEDNQIEANRCIQAMVERNYINVLIYRIHCRHTHALIIHKNGHCIESTLTEYNTISCLATCWYPSL